MTALEQRIADHCRTHSLEVVLSHRMPAKYETALGTYVPETRTLHLNAEWLQTASQPDALFTLYHELRHAEQYQHPERFSPAIRESLPYVILYDGQCFKQSGGGWLSCRLDGDEAFFTLAYLSLPYELDANAFACRMVEAEAGSAAAEEFRRFWIPEAPMPPEEFIRLFRRIDQAAHA